MLGYILAIVAIVLFIYKTRAIYPNDPNIYVPKQFLPYVGSIISLSTNMHRHLPWKVQLMQDAEKAGKEMSCWSMLACPPYFEVGSPRMVEYMLKTNFDNFAKGEYFQSIFREVLGRGIFNTDGDEWRGQRKVASHMFSSRQLNEYMFEVFQEHSNIIVNKLEALGEFTVVDMQNLFQRYTLDSICQIAFGISLHSLTSEGEKQPPFAVSFDAAQEIAALRWFEPPFVWQVKKFFKIGTEGEMPHHIHTINTFVYEVVRARKANLAQFENSGDLLSLFLNEAKRKGEELSDDFLRDVILNFLIAGRDTTASALTYMFKTLSDYPAIETKICDELHAVLGENGEVDETNIKQLNYLEATFLETVRLNAPVHSDLKFVTKECTFPNGATVPAGAVVSYSPYCLARLKKHWGEDCEEFRPERWLDEDGHIVQPSQFVFPQFNAGFRLCLGRSMAIIEAKVLAANILQRFSLHTLPGHDCTERLTIVLCMKNGLKMTVRPRNNAY